MEQLNKVDDEEEIGDLYVITFMPNTAHQCVVAELRFLFYSYVKQYDLYNESLRPIFVSPLTFHADGGMALRARNRERLIYNNTILLDVEKSHRTLLELHAHIIQHMITMDTICYSIAIKIFSRQQDHHFSAVCLLFKKDEVNQNHYCFYAYDFGTAAITTECTNMLQELSIPIWIAEPRVTLDANIRLLPPNNPWNTPTFSIPGRFNFGNSREPIVLGGITLTIPDNPTDLDVDLFEVLKGIAIDLPRCTP